MKVLCDVHIAYKVVNFFISQGIEAQHVNSLPEKSETSDREICIFADKYAFTVLTKDSDFQNSHFINNTPQRLLKISLGNISNAQLIQILSENLETFIKCFDKGKCFIEVQSDCLTIIAN